MAAGSPCSEIFAARGFARDGPIFFRRGNKTATNGMTKRHPFENQYRSSLMLLACPVPKERSFHLSVRTLQHKGHPHPVLSRSTPRNFPLGLSPKISRSTELEARLSLAL